MVTDAIWNKVVGRKGMLCIGCLEARLGRTLISTDFTACPLNLESNGKSPRLNDRLIRS